MALQPDCASGAWGTLALTARQTQDDIIADAWFGSVLDVDSMTSPTLEGVGRPDVVLIGPEWPIRALLRAQLLEEGYDVVATDGWPLPRQYLRPEGMPRLVIVDLHGLPEPRRVLAALRTLFDPGRVLVLTALGAVTVEEIHALGLHHVVRRPTAVQAIVAAAAALLGSVRSKP